jgi:hypothetical protein
MPSHEDSGPAATARPSRCERGWFLAAAVALAIAAFAATFTQVFDYDAFWHLAAGEWMLAHGAVLGTDPFSVQPLPEWVNVHWLFQVIVASLHALGGFGLLSAMKATLAAATMGVFALALRRAVPPAWTVVCGLAAIVLIETRCRVRPEAFTMLFLMATIALVEHVRRGGGLGWLWLLAPMMAAWVNMHGLYVLGPAVFWSAALGAALDARLGRGESVRSVPLRLSSASKTVRASDNQRLAASQQAGLASWQAVAPLAAATAACLVSPWPLEAVAQPLLLWTRISGQTAAFTQGVSEFQPTWQSAFYGGLAAGIVVPTVLACLLRWRTVPLAHAVWLAAFAGLAGLACRNVALTGPVCGYLLALHGGQLWRTRGRRNGDWLRSGELSADSVPVPISPAGPEMGTGTDAANPDAASGPPRSQSPFSGHLVIVGLRVASLALAAALAGAYATEWLFRVEGVPRRFGPGLYGMNYATEIAQRLAAVPGGGDVFCENWGDAGPFIYYCQPRRLWMDGRLEAHALDRFLSQGRISEALRSPASAAAIELPRELRFFFVRSLSRDHLTGLALSGRFRLRFVDPTGACFERLDWSGAALRSVLAKQGAQGDGAQETNLADYDRPLGADMRVQGLPVEPRRWWRQNPPSPNYPLGAMFLWLGWQPTQDLDPADAVRDRLNLLAVRYLEAALADGLTDRPTATGMLAFAHQRRAMYEDVTPSEAVPIDLHSARALYLYGLMDLTNLADGNTRRFAEQHVDALVRARLIDLADQAAAGLLRDLPPGADPALRRQYTELARRIAARLADSRRRAAALTGPPADRARALAGPEIGLILDAIQEARKIQQPDRRALLAGDLNLRAGRVAQAGDCYGSVPIGHNGIPAGFDRSPIVVAVTSKYSVAEQMLDQRPKRPGQDQTPYYTYYRALALEILGRYDQAREALTGVESQDEQLSRLLEALRARLPR